jgi:hypothetical protein
MIDDVDALDEIIKEVAVKHEFALSRDDPVLLVYTIQKRLLAESADAQQLLFDQFREELEETLDNREKEIACKADRALNHGVAVARGALTAQMQHDLDKITETLRKHIAIAQPQLLQELQKCQRASNIGLMASVLTLAAAALVLWNSLGNA